MLVKINNKTKTYERIDPFTIEISDLKHSDKENMFYHKNLEIYFCEERKKIYFNSITKSIFCSNELTPSGKHIYLLKEIC